MPEHASRALFEDFVGVSLEASSPEELFEHLTVAVGHQGFDKVIFSVTHDGELPKDKNQLGIFYNYPSDWQKHYQQKRFDLIDPVLKYAATASGPFKWSDLETRFNLSKKQHRFFREGEDAGLNNGIGVPLRGNRGQLSGIALASSEKKDACNQNLDLINAYCHQFYIAYKRFFISDEISSEQELVTLTFKETEVLNRMAEGKTDDEIAMATGNSKHTVNIHMRNIFKKLGVNNRVAAVVKGITLGLATP